MPPKKAAVQEEDLSLIWIVIDVHSAKLSVAKSGEQSNNPTLSVAARVPGEDAPSISDATPPSEDPVAYAFAWSRTVKRAPGAQLLQDLLNNPVTLDIQDAGGTILASAALDLLELGLGAQSFSKSLPLQASKSLEGTGLTVTAHSIEVSVKLLQRVLVPPAEDAAEGSPPVYDTVAAALVPAAEAPGCNVAELSLQILGPIPEGLLSANTFSGGRLTVTAGLSVSGGGSVQPLLLLSNAAVREGAVQLPAVHRAFVSTAANEALKAAVEEGVPISLELARYLVGPGSEGFSDPGFASYHAFTQVDLSEGLGQPGTSDAEGRAAILHSFSAASQAGLAASSILPPYTPPPKAGKAIEDVPPPAPGTAASSSWADAGCQVGVRLKLARSLFPPWQPPPKPSKPIEEIIPARPLKPAEPPRKATTEFQDKVKAMVRALASEYRAVASSVASNSEVSPAEVRKALFFELNKSGKYLQLRDGLKAAAVSVAKELYTKEGETLSADELKDLHGRLYMDLVDNMHVALHDITHVEPPKPSPSQADTASELALLKTLADERELAEDWLRAEEMHMQRLTSAPEDPQVWLDYAMLNLRLGRHGRAEEALREAASLAPQHPTVLAALCCLLLHQGVFTDPVFLDSAEAVAGGLRAAHPGSPTPWALLTILYRAMGRSRDAEVRNCHTEVVRLCKAAAAEGLPPAEWNTYLQVAQLLLDMRLPDLARQALQLAGSLKDSALPLRVEMFLAEARALQLLGEVNKALESAKEAQKASAPGEVLALVALGNILYGAGSFAEATKAYEQAIQSRPTGCPPELYLHLGHSFLSNGQPQHAVDVFLQACTATPSCSFWLGAAMSYLQMGDLERADLALTEANILDPKHPAVWGYLALVAVRSGRLQESDLALKQALKLRLSDAQLLLDVGNAYLDAGKFREAAEALQQALKLKDSFQARLLLGQAYGKQCEVQQAMSQFEVALQLSSSVEEQTLVKRFSLAVAG